LTLPDPDDNGAADAIVKRSAVRIERSPKNPGDDKENSNAHSDGTTYEIWLNPECWGVIEDWGPIATGGFPADRVPPSAS
jgi:hypothetical protein